MPDSLTDKDVVSDDKPDFNKIEQAAISVARDVVKGIDITEEDKVKSKASIDKLSTVDEDKFALELQVDLQNFISDKVDIDIGEGEIERLPTGIDILET